MNGQGSYDSMSNGGGETVSYDGVTFQVQPLGFPESGNPPHCVVIQPDGFQNVGTGSTDNIGLPGVTGVDQKCIHDFAC